MFNVLIVDGALNCAYDVFSFTEDEFHKIFPGDGQDIAFLEDLQDSGMNLDFLQAVWGRPVAKKDVKGIHGILFIQLYEKKEFYPNLKDSDLDGTGRAFSTISR
ncbi:hypothetical protein [Afifella sp. YEN Y35]|uniref:hypothetical protein n=1 Tax=Afifella sp. YEN Y35 TaxID=3388337 RepID=UPI0039E03FDE